MGRGIIAMSLEEAKRLHVVRKVIEKQITQVEAAALVGTCLRQFQRIVQRVRSEGDQGICHRARGKKPNNRISETVKTRIVELCRGRYREFGPTLASEKLLEKNRLQVSAETLRTWLLEAGLPYRKRRKRPHRQWRERKACRGALVQLDGSHHDWFEGRGPRCVLMGYVDDATGEVYARFYAYEGTLPAMDSFKRYIRRYGIPQSVYLDRHSTYKAPVHHQTIEDQLEDRQSLSHFEKSLQELKVTVIHAYSPQAKGRVERLFGTFQDRLVKEMRLAGISTQEEGNAFLSTYLPKYNKQFRVSPAQDADLHRPYKDHRQLDRILSIRNERALRNDFTIAHDKKLYQIKDNIRAKKVLVEERTDGSMRILHNGQRLRFQEITARSKKERKESLKLHKTWDRGKPTGAHPWRAPLNLEQREKTAVSSTP